MGCKYKSYHEECSKPWCKASGGECQFIEKNLECYLCPLAREESLKQNNKESKKKR